MAWPLTWPRTTSPSTSPPCRIPPSRLRQASTRPPLLARIPAIPRVAGNRLAMLVDPDKTLTPTFEAYRIAKLNLTAALDRTRARAIMFTAAGEDEGTSQTAGNLAVVLARSGKH